MNIIRYSDLSDEQRRCLVRRPNRMSARNTASVRRICREVQRTKDSAVRRYTKQFDKKTIRQFAVPESHLIAALSCLSVTLRNAFETAANNIRQFHNAQRNTSAKTETMPGVVCWREVRAIERVGLYIPAGSAPLPSTVFMLGIPATIAGCRQIALCSPPTSSGSVDPLVCAASAFLGIKEVYCVGGVQAIAAMAYGTQSIPRVDKIFGPGNRFVTAAKQLVSSDPDGCAIDMLAGPSEVLIIADEQANPVHIAWDLISQAEHDADAQAVLVTTSASLADRVADLVRQFAKDLPRAVTIRASLKRSYILLTSTIDEAVCFSNDYAPEHLIVNTSDQGSVVRQVVNAGSVFLGGYSPVSAGDYASGTNHTLPTNGTARALSGISLSSFQKDITFQSLTKMGLQLLAPTITAFSTAEGLDGHRWAVESRFGEPQ